MVWFGLGTTNAWNVLSNLIQMRRPSDGEQINMDDISRPGVRESPDVRAERQRLWGAPQAELKAPNRVVLFELCKKYGKLRAVDKVSNTLWFLHIQNYVDLLRMV